MLHIKNKVIELRVFKTWLDDESICRTIVKPNAIIELQDALENTAAVKEISLGSIYPLLVDLKAINSISKEARDYFSMQKRTAEVCAIAILVKSAVSHIIGNFFLRLSNPTVPTQLYTDEAKAINWLKQFNQPVQK